MGDPHDPFQAPDDADLPSEAPLGDGLDDDTALTSQTLNQQLVQHLTRLRQEYRQIRAWLEKAQAQLTHREAQVGRHLLDALAMTEQLKRSSYGERSASHSEHSSCDRVDAAIVHVQVLGRFVARYRGEAVSLGSSKAGRALFRYLVTRPGKRAARDVLLELFWPDDPQASHKLHIAVSALRGALNEELGGALEGGESILYADDCYALAPDLLVQLDADAFAAHVRAGEKLEREGSAPEAITEYRAACALYQGDFLVQDLYVDWTIARRAALEEMYLTSLGRLTDHYLDHSRYEESISCSRQILARDSFREDAYRQLMCCYSRMGRRNQALREFQACKEVLRQELGVDPMRETVELYQRIVRQEPV